MLVAPPDSRSPSSFLSEEPSYVEGSGDDVLRDGSPRVPARMADVVVQDSVLFILFSWAGINLDMGT